VSEKSAEKYREWAAQCLSLAERAQRDDDKATWLELAGKWQRLSQEAERNHVTQQAQQPQSLASHARQVMMTVGMWLSASAHMPVSN
jgi:hypothetical protein